MFSFVHNKWYYKHYFLTCAHNICAVFYDKIYFYNSHTVFVERNGNKAYDSKYKIGHFFVHPKYDGNPRCGYDIAIMVPLSEIEEENPMPTFITP